MTLGEFRKLTKEMPDTIDLYMGERLTEFRYGLVNSAKLKTISFSEEPDGSGEIAIDEVIVLQED